MDLIKITDIIPYILSTEDGKIFKHTGFIRVASNIYPTVKIEIHDIEYSNFNIDKIETFLTTQSNTNLSFYKDISQTYQTLKDNQ